MNQVNEATNNDLTSVALQKEAAAVRAWDPSRPTYVNFGKCMSISQWDGCHTDIESPPPASYRAMMQQYCSAADIESTDDYGYTDPYEPTAYHGAYTYGLAIVNDKAMCGAAKPPLGFSRRATPSPTAARSLRRRSRPQCGMRSCTGPMASSTSSTTSSPAGTPRTGC